jgi:hypothetical protein
MLPIPLLLDKHRIFCFQKWFDKFRFVVSELKKTPDVKKMLHLIK